MDYRDMQPYSLWEEIDTFNDAFEHWFLAHELGWFDVVYLIVAIVTYLP